MEEERARRIGLNEALFRSINERIEGLNRDFAELSGTINIVCECGEIRCAERIDLPLAEYERLRSEPTHFAIVPGHEINEVEQIVSECADYHVVEKHPGTPAALAAQTQPRQPDN
jgi:hypothetical protein